jgi:hypothetical protein
MKATFYLSIALDLLAILVMFIPRARFARWAKDEMGVRKIKWICAAILLISGYLIDRYITHGA